MAKIKQANKKNVVAVFEDPRPTANTIYFFGDGYNKETLAPVFDQHLLMDPDNGPYQTYGLNNSTDSYESAGAPGFSMAVTKLATHVIHSAQTGNDSRLNLDYTYAMSMDPSNPSTCLKHWTDGTSDLVTWVAPTPDSHYLEVYWSSMPETREMSEVNPTRSHWMQSRDTNYGEYSRIHGWFYRDPNTDYLSGLFNRWAGQYRDPRSHNSPSFGITRFNTFPSYSSLSTLNYKEYYMAQYIGASDVDGKPMYLFNDRRVDYRQNIYRHNTSDNTETTLHSFSSTPLASGSNYGGARDTSSGIKSQAKVSSQTFDDPTSSGNKCWYTPYFDTSNNYFPFFFQWNKTDDTFTRNEDVAVTGDLSSTHLNNLDGVQGDNSGLKSIIYNETFVFSGSRYLTVFPLDGGYEVNDSAETARTVITYSVDAANPKSLTHHSAVTVPQTIKNIAWLNDAKTQFGAICDGGFHIYTFNATDGWVKTTTFPYQVWSIGRDSAGKVYATTYNSGGYVDIHLITATTPTSVVITPASSTYDYQGTTIDSTVAVSAFGSDGERLALSVDLEIEGSTMTFGDGTTTATVTTSDSADVNQAIKITGAGFSDIIARVQI